jgi:hypothetical protein
MKKERKITNTSRNCRLVSVYQTLSVNRQYNSKTNLVDFHHPHSDIGVDFIFGLVTLVWFGLAQESGLAVWLSLMR